MSIVWLEPFIFDPTESNILTFQSVNLMIYLNLISIICYVIYSLLYKSSLNLQKAPNTIIIWKMFGECLVSFHLLILFLCFSFENNKRKIGTTGIVIFITSLISPLAIFISYFFNLCIAHNLFTTFYAYRNSYDNRMKVYKIYAFVLGVIVALLSVLFNKRINESTVRFNISYYPLMFIAIFYLIGAYMIIFTILKLIYVIRNRSTFYSFLNEQQGPKGDLIKLFVKRHFSFIFGFLLTYGPNNVIIIIQIFSPIKICNICTYYSVSLYLMSFSCTISFIIKISEPYMQKYLTILITHMKTTGANSLDTEDEGDEGDYTKLYNDQGLGQTNDNLIDKTENLADSLSTPSNPNRAGSIQNNLRRLSSELQTMIDPLNTFTKEMEASDFLSRMIGITLSIEQDKRYDKDPQFNQRINSYLPWEDNFYNDKTKLEEFTQASIPEWLKVDIQMTRVNVRKYSPSVFHHLRKMDGLSISDVLSSLDPMKNLKIINESFASGGRSANPIIFSHDKKLLLKTIAKEEKDALIKMLPEFHRRMRDCQSFLCRIYGIFRIRVSDKQCAHVLLMRNMNELPSDSKILVFDLKGSTVDRNVLELRDKDMINNNKKQEVIEKYKKNVLKDNDFKLLGYELKLSKKDAQLFQNNISADAELLKGEYLTDYSLLLSIHKYNKEDFDKNFKNYRIMKSYDDEYIYCVSIIDFLTRYGVMKRGEYLLKRMGKEKNFSVQDPITYSRRFIRNVITCLKDEDTSILVDNTFAEK